MPKTKHSKAKQSKKQAQGPEQQKHNRPTKKNSRYDVISIGTVAVPRTIHRTNTGQNMIDSSTTSMTKS
jgi:hypothetical protein